MGILRRDDNGESTSDISGLFPRTLDGYHFDTTSSVAQGDFVSLSSTRGSTIVRLVCTQDCYYSFDEAGTVQTSATMNLLPANKVEYVTVKTSGYTELVISYARVTVDGILNLIEMS